MLLLWHSFLSLPQYGNPSGQKVCCLREKTHHSSSCRGSIIAFTAEITQVLEAEPGNVVWMSLSAIRKRSNIWSCLLPSHSSTLSDTPILTRLYKPFDKAGKSEACYQPGKLWCKVVGEMPTKHLPWGPLLDSHIQRLSFPAGYSRFTYFIHLQNKQ